MELEELQKFCLSFPAVTEDIKWGNNLVFSIGSKMFCVVSLEVPFTFSFKVKDDEFEELSTSEGFAPAPYMARAKWILVTDPIKLKKKDLEKYISESYTMIKAKLTKKLRLELGID